MVFFWMLILPIIILFIILLGVGVTLVRAILRFLGFSTGSSIYNGMNTNRQSSSRQQAEGDDCRTHSQNPSNTRKIIGDDEGEYVEFEEVKE